MPSFDAIADRFDRFRALPDGVAGAVRECMRAVAGTPPGRLLEVGAGTGRFGLAFAEAGDDYVGTDPSRPMIERFASKLTRPGGRPYRLVLADGLALPFADRSFDATLMVSVLSGVPRWRGLLAEARRVLRPGGALALGRTVRPEGGVDARMKGRLGSILEAMGIDARKPGAAREHPHERLGGEATRHQCVTAARWEVRRSPSDFLARHQTGARFSSLPEPVRREALRRLSEWSIAEFGDAEIASIEDHSVELDIYHFGGD